MDNDPSSEAIEADRVHLEVVGGVVRACDEGIGSPESGAAPAELSWPADAVRVSLDDEAVEGSTCRVPPGATLHVQALDVAARTQYVVMVSRDRMEATLRVLPEPGWRRRIEDSGPSTKLRLRIDEERIEPEPPTFAQAQAELQRAEVAYGVDPERIRDALESPGEEFVVATGLDPIEGRNGYLEQLVDFAALRSVGVLADTPLLRRVRRRDGVPGRDVTGRELSVPAVKDARIRPGEGVSVDERGVMAIASVDGAPYVDGEGNVEVRHVLVLEVVDTVSGDVDFNGSVRIEGDVGDGRTVIARGEIVVKGNVDRAHLESGGSILVEGAIMSSVLRAGGERAVAATIADRVLELPRLLALVAAQARQMRDSGESRGTEVSHGLSIQLVLERIHRSVLPDLATILDDLREAGPAHAGTCERVALWHRRLSTAANVGLTLDQFQEILVGVNALAADVQRATEQPSDLTVSYMQASEAEATGTVTLTGKGIFNSRIVAWGGLVAEQYDAVLRGGSIVSHGRVHVREVGSPAGAKTLVQLGKDAELQADKAYAGTIVTGPGYTHRFVADRSVVKVAFDLGGSMNVESLAA